MRFAFFRPHDRSFATPSAWLVFALAGIGDVLQRDAFRGWEDPWWHITGEILLVALVIGGGFAVVSWLLDRMLW